MYPKCSLSDSNIYLQIVGLLSLVIIMIIAWFYYMRVYHTTIMEKYDEINTNTIRNIPANEMESGNRSTFPKDKYPGIRTELVSTTDKQISDNTRTNTLNTTNDKYTLRPCKVYFTSKDNIDACDDKDDKDPTKTCSYKFDGWQEFATYTDKNGDNIEYPKKTYQPNASNTEELINSYFTSKCFKEFGNEGQGAAQNFVHKENALVKYDSKGIKDNTEVDTNIFGGKRYTSIQFLNSTIANDNFNNVLDSICSVKYDKIHSITGKQFYKFILNKIDNKLVINDIKKVSLNNDQTTFINIPNTDPLTGFANLGAYGLRFAKDRNDTLEVFVKIANAKPVAVNVYKFTYVSYLCEGSQIKISTMIPLTIDANRFLNFGSPNINNNIKDPFPNPDTNATSAKIKSLLGKYFTIEDAKIYQGDNGYAEGIIDKIRDKIKKREGEINSTSKTEIDNLEGQKDAKVAEINQVSNKKRTYSPADNDRSFSGVINLQKNNINRERIFNYNKGYNNTSIGYELSIPAGATISCVNSTDACFTFTSGTSGTSGTYKFEIPSGLICDILLVGGGGGGGFDGSGGGGGGEVKYYTNNTTSFKTGSSYTFSREIYTINVGSGGIRAAGATSAASNGNVSEIKNNAGTTLFTAGGGGGGGSRNTSGVSGVGGGGGAGHGPEGAYRGASSTGSGGIGGNPGTPYTGGGGGGGANVANKNGENGSTSRAGAGGVGVNIDINGESTGYGGGGGGGTWFSLTQVFGTQGGGNGGTETTMPTSGKSGTGGGGGGGGNAGDRRSTGFGGDGGSGIVIIIVKNYFQFPGIPADVESLYNSEPMSIINLPQNKLQFNLITAFIFLQAGYYRFTADIGNNGIIGNTTIKYAELLIYDESNYNSGIYYGRKVFKYSTNKSNQVIPSYLKPYIYIPKSKFFKLAYQYFSHNTTSSTNFTDQGFIVKYKYSSTEPAKDDESSILKNIASNPNVVSFDGNYDKYMIFTVLPDSGNQTQYIIDVPENYSVDILLVGGGGGGGFDGSGGGGGGEVKYYTDKSVGFKSGSSQILNKGSYIINVGTGGRRGDNVNSVSNNGNITEIKNRNTGATLYTAGGGGGGGSRNTHGSNGTGGGAGGAGHGSTYIGGTSIGTGGKGGNANAAYTGGGGAGGANIPDKNGADGTRWRAGQGGSGVYIDISGRSVGYGGGGGGGTYISAAKIIGTAGGGNGATERESSTPGVDNTGGGGGGGGNAGISGPLGGNGGSGIVIIRYRNIRLSTTLDDASIKLSEVSKYNDDNAYSADKITELNTAMSPYILSGKTLYKDYKNTADPTIMNIFSTIKYEGNTYSDNVNIDNYQRLAFYLGTDAIDFYDTKTLDSQRKKLEKDIEDKKTTRDNNLNNDTTITELRTLLNSVLQINYTGLITLGTPQLRSDYDILSTSSLYPNPLFNDTHLTYEKISANYLLNQKDLLNPQLAQAIYIEALD